MKIQLEIIEYRISTISLIRPTIFPLLMLVLVLSLFVPITVNAYGTDFFSIGIIILSIYSCYIIIPTWILHVNYYKHDKGKVVIIDKTKELITVTKDEQIRVIPFKEIEYLEKLRPARIFFSLVPAYYYCYCINLKNKQSVYLSRFLVQRLEKELPGISFDDVECFYPYIKKDIEKAYR